MRLMTVKQAASELFVSTGLVHYWIRTGRAQKHVYKLTPGSAKVKKRTESTWRFMVDLDELRAIQRKSAEAELKLLNSDKRLLRPREISQILDVRHDRVHSWAKRYNLKKYYIPGNSVEYFLDGDELADNLEDSGLGYLIK